MWQYKTAKAFKLCSCSRTGDDCLRIKHIKAPERKEEREERGKERETVTTTESKRGRSEQEDDVMLIGLKLHGPSGISLPLTDVWHPSEIKQCQQEDFLL